MKRHNTYFLIIALIAASFTLIRVSTGVAQTSESADTDAHNVYELRTYITFEGKLNDLHKRFSNHTMDLFEKHGIKNIGYWTPMDEENTLIYIIAHESRDAAELSWEAFINDPEWQEVYEASRVDGPLVEHIESVFMTNTDFSPMK